MKKDIEMSREIELQPLHEIRVVPALGGMISDRPPEGERYSENVWVPVTKELARAFKMVPSPRFMVTRIDGNIIALSPDVGRSLGLEDIGDWKNA